RACEALRQRTPAGVLSQPRPQGLGRGAVDLERLLVRKDHAICLARKLECREVVEQVLAHLLRISLEWVPVARRVRLSELDELARRERDAGHLGRQDLLSRSVGVLAARGHETVPAAEDPDRRIGLAVALA